MWDVQQRNIDFSFLPPFSSFLHRTDALMEAFVPCANKRLDAFNEEVRMKKEADRKKSAEEHAMKKAARKRKGAGKVRNASVQMVLECQLLLNDVLGVD